jgi:tRNA-dihydrouridine synthase
MTSASPHPLDPLRQARRVSVAPMMDWTDRHCRHFHRLLSRGALLYTEMVTTGALLHGDVPRHLDFGAGEHPVALQLGGSEPADLAHAPGWASSGATTRSTSTAAARASGCSAARSAPA